MIAQFEPLFEPVAARLQADLGEFLADRQLLLQLRDLADTSDELTTAVRLLAQQADLEAELPAVLRDYDALRQQGPTLYGTSRMIGFVGRMEAHVGQVRDVQRRLGTRGVVQLPPPVATVVSTAALWLGAAASVLLLLASQVGRRGHMNGSR